MGEYMFNIGDYVTRNSYNNDIVFKIIGINNDVYYLKGVCVRLYADSYKEDLVLCQDYEDKDKFIAVIKEALEKVVKEGVDKKALKAAINRYEFKHREADFDGYPKGLIYGLDMFGSWLYDDNQPFMRMSVNDTYAFLKEKIDTDYYENLIKKYLIDNDFASFVAVIPKPGYGKEIEQATKDKLAKYKASLSEEEIVKLIEDTKALKKFQEEPSTDEELKTSPMLTIGDIKKEAYKINNQITIRSHWHQLSHLNEHLQ